MKLEMFINFDGNCREAVEFYAKVFKAEVGNLITYSDAPPDPNYAVPEADVNRIRRILRNAGAYDICVLSMAFC